MMKPLFLCGHKVVRKVSTKSIKINLIYVYSLYQ